MDSVGFPRIRGIAEVFPVIVKVGLPFQILMGVVMVFTLPLIFPF